MGKSPPDRIAAFEACFNFRDLGGYETRNGGRVRWKTLYRSDSLHRLSPGDQLRFERLGVGVVIDLRSREEIADFGRLEPGLEGIEWHHRPLIESVRLRAGERSVPAGEERAEQLPGEGYFGFLGSGDVATSVLSLIAESPGPAVFHCTSGKDRTGIIAAMVLDLLGVPEETIAEDYLLTQETRARSMAWIEEHEPNFAAFLNENPPESREVRPEAILAFLDRLRSAHGSVADLARANGMTPEQLRRLRERLLEA